MNIGISISGQENYYGPLIVALVMYDNNLFRKTYIKLNESAEQIFKLSNTRLEMFHFWKTKPEDIKNRDTKEIQLKSIIECLNLVKDFWKYKIDIDFDDTVYFCTMFKKLLPKNLRNLDINMDRFKLCGDSKSAQLARKYAEYYMNIELKDIKMVYPNIDEEGFTSKNKDCPYLRKWVKEE